MKTKKISWQAIAIVVLALVLIASIALGVSGAWFQDNDAVQQTSKMGEAVTIRLGDTSAEDPVTTWSGTYKDTKPYPGDTIMGHTQVYMVSETPSVVRGSIDIKVFDKDSHEVTNLPAANPEMTGVEKPVMPDKSADTYWTVDEKGNTVFNQTAWDNAVTAYETACKTYDKQLLANMLAVTLENGKYKDKWEKATSGKYYFKELANSATTIQMFDALVLSTDLSNQVAEWTITVNVKVEAIQAANLVTFEGETPTVGNADWYNDLPATIKAAVNKYNKTDRVNAGV